LTTISGIVLLPILTKTLGAYGYGLWSQALVTISLFVLLLRFGAPFSIARLFPGKKISEMSKELSSILALIIAVVGTFSIILFAFPYPLANAVFDGEVLIVKLVAVIIFVSCLDKIFHAVFQAFREMKKLATINVTSMYIEVGLAVTLVLLGYGIIGAIVAVLIVRGPLSVVLFILISRKIPLTRPEFYPLKKHLSIGLPAIPGAISHLLVDVSDRYVIGIFLGTTFVGYYTPGYSLGMMVPIFIASVLAFVLLPSLSGYYENNNIRMVKRILNLSTKYFLLITIPSFIGIILVGKPILLLLTTQNIAQNSYIILVLSAFAGLLFGLYDIFKVSIFLKKRTRLFAVIWFFGAGINLIGNIIFIPRIGIVAAAITTILSYMIVTTLVVYFAKKNFPFKMDYLSLLKIVASALLMGILIYVVRIYLWSNLFLLIVMGIFIYFSSLFIMRGIDKKEIGFLRGIHK